ncbi:MAG: hypothetical protein V1817_02485 [Candidatus Micrarchaeota archaeon]
MVSGNALQGISGHGCPIAIQHMASASLGSNYVCNNIYPECYHGTHVFYCDPLSTVSDLSRNTVERSNTNCPISPRACLVSATAVAMDNGRNLPVKTFKAANSIAAAPPEQSSEWLTYGVAGVVGLLIVVGALAWHFKHRKK